MFTQTSVNMGDSSPELLTKNIVPASAQTQQFGKKLEYGKKQSFYLTSKIIIM